MAEYEPVEGTIDVAELLRSDPQRYLRMTSEWIAENPHVADFYFNRHLAWLSLDEPHRALEDLHKAVELGCEIGLYWRGRLYWGLSDYERALQDLDDAEAMDPVVWGEHVPFGLLFQADCHARLGDDAKAQTYCTRLPDDFLSAQIDGLPSGDKTTIATALRRVATEARRMRM